MKSSANALILFLLASLGAAGAAWPNGSDGRLCDQAAKLAAQMSDTPLEVLQAIARVETGRDMRGESTPWPWTVNYAGKGYWFETEAEALAFATKLIAEGQDNFDLGCFQVNQYWHGTKFASLQAALSPKSNALVAASYLRSHFDQSGDWGQAVASYHSKTEQNGQAYLVKVEAMLQRMRGGPGQTAEPEQLARVEPENSYPLLRQGTVSRGASLVPINDGGTALFDVGQ